MKKNIQIFFSVLLLGLGYSAYDLYDWQGREGVIMANEKAKGEVEINARKDEIKRLENFVQNINSIKLELTELKVQLDGALEYMPRTFKLSDLLRKLTQLAASSGVELNSFRPKKSEEKSSGTFYVTMGIDFEVRGSFTQTLVFFDQLSRLRRIVNVDSIKIRPGDAQGQSRAGASLVTSATSVRTYRFSE